MTKWVGTRRIITVCIISSFLLNGCKINQDKEVSFYTDILHAKDEKPPAVLQANQPLSLLDALRQTIWYNEQLAIQGESFLQALIDKDRSVANFIPTISYTPTFTWQNKISSPPSSPIQIQTFEPPKAIDQPLTAGVNFNLLGNIADIKVTGAEADRRKELLLNLKSNILLDTANIYYQVLILESRLSFLEYSAAVQRANVKDMRSKYNSGTATQSDLALAQSQLSQTNVSLVKARSDVANVRAELALLIGASSVNGPLSDMLSLPTELPDKEQLLSIAEHNRNDLKASKYQLEESIHLLKRAWSQCFPSVSLDFTYFLSRQSFPSQLEWINALRFNLPVFSAGLIHSDVRSAWSLVRQANYAHSYLIRQTNEQLKIALCNYRNMQTQVEDYNVVVRAARDDFNRTDNAYKVGIATSLELMQSQDRLKNAEFELTSARLTEKLYYLNLLQIIGRFDEQSLKKGFTLNTIDTELQP